MGCGATVVITPRKMPLTSEKEPANHREYWGQAQSNDRVHFGLTLLENKTERFCYLGYHTRGMCTGFGEMSTKFGLIEAWGMFHDQDPCGLTRVLFNSNSEYMGLMKRQQEGRGKFKMSKLENVGQYKGYYHAGTQHYFGEITYPNWYYVGEFRNNQKGPFGKYKHIEEMAVYKYLGQFAHDFPDGQGILTLKYYQEYPMLQYAEGTNKPAWQRKVTCVGTFKEGAQCSGKVTIEEVGKARRMKKFNGQEDVDIEDEVLAEEIVSSVRKTFAALNDDIYSYDFKDLVDHHISVKLILDKISTIRLELTKSNHTVVFAKGRLCGSLDEVAYAIHEARVLELLSVSSTAERGRHGVEQPIVYPKLVHTELYPGCPPHPVYDMRPGPLMKTLVPDLQREREFYSLYYMTYMTYIPETQMLPWLVKNRNLSMSDVAYLFFKTIDALKILEGFGVLRGQTKMSSVSIFTARDKIIIKLMGYANARFFSESELKCRWMMLDQYKAEIMSRNKAMLHPNEFQKSKRQENAGFIGHLCPWEYKNKKTLYLPPDIKKLMHSSNWKKRLLEVNYGKLTLYSTAMAFLKAFAIVLSFAETRCPNYTTSYFYQQLQKLKLLEYIDNSEVSLQECVDKYKEMIKNLIQDMKDKVKELMSLPSAASRSSRLPAPAPAPAQAMVPNPTGEETEVERALNIIEHIQEAESAYNIAELNADWEPRLSAQLLAVLNVPRIFPEKPRVTPRPPTSIVPKLQGLKQRRNVGERGPPSGRQTGTLAPSARANQEAAQGLSVINENEKQEDKDKDEPSNVVVRQPMDSVRAEGEQAILVEEAKNIISVTPIVVQPAKPSNSPEDGKARKMVIKGKKPKPKPMPAPAPASEFPAESPVKAWQGSVAEKSLALGEGEDPLRIGSISTSNPSASIKPLQMPPTETPTKETAPQSKHVPQPKPRDEEPAKSNLDPSKGQAEKNAESAAAEPHSPSKQKHKEKEKERTKKKDANQEREESKTKEKAAHKDSDKVDMKPKEEAGKQELNREQEQERKREQERLQERENYKKKYMSRYMTDTALGDKPKEAPERRSPSPKHSLEDKPAEGPRESAHPDDQPADHLASSPKTKAKAILHGKGKDRDKDNVKDKDKNNNKDKDKDKKKSNEGELASHTVDEDNKGKDNEKEKEKYGHHDSTQQLKAEGTAKTPETKDARSPKEKRKGAHGEREEQKHKAADVANEGKDKQKKAGHKDTNSVDSLSKALVSAESVVFNNPGEEGAQSAFKVSESSHPLPGVKYDPIGKPKDKKDKSKSKQKEQKDNTRETHTLEMDPDAKDRDIQYASLAQAVSTEANPSRPGEVQSGNKPHPRHSPPDSPAHL